MSSADVAALVARISFAAPVLYAALWMALDPARFVAGLQRLARFLHEQSPAAFSSRDLELQKPQPASARQRNALRFTGAWLILGAFVHIAGFLN